MMAKLVTRAKAQFIKIHKSCSVIATSLHNSAQLFTDCSSSRARPVTNFTSLRRTISSIMFPDLALAPMRRSAGLIMLYTTEVGKIDTKC